MEQLNIANGGVQYIPQITAVQYVYLDFDGELTSYNGELLTVENVEVLHSELTEERIENILDELNRKYAAEDVIFVTWRPENVEYSTIYIGKTGDFDAYGSFAGLAETIDTGNQNKADKAFVLLDSTDTNESIIAIIAHETNHLLGTLNHGGEGIHAYATTYNVASGATLSNKDLMFKTDTVNVRNRGTVYDINLSNGATINIYDGGLANRTTIDGGGIMNISSGGIANSTTANGSTSIASMFIYDGGCANYTSVWSYAVMHVKSGGIANYTSVACHGYYSWTASVSVSSGGIVNDTELSRDGRENNQRLTILDGGVANRTTAYAGSVYISSGGMANSTFIYSGAQMYIAGGTANSTAINSGASIHIAGGATNDTVISSGASMHLASGGTASNTFINSGASMYIASGGTALETLENGGYVNVEDGANATFVSNTLNEIVLSNGGMTVHRNTVANSTIVSSGGSIFIYSGGIANSTTATQQGYMYICGGVANSTVLSSSGYMHISSGGLANQTIIKSGGTLHISSGGIANSTTVSSGGKINLFGTHTGRMLIRYGGVVSAYSGSIIDFTVAGQTSADDSLISDLSLIIGAPTFTLTVSDNQADGAYRLARGAEEFTGTITIGDGITEYGAVTVNGDSLLYNNRFYTLIQNDGSLTLNIAPIGIPENLRSSAGGVSWDAVYGANAYVLQYSKDDFASVLTVNTVNTAVDTYCLPADSNLWRVKASGGDWSENQIITDITEQIAPELAVSDADGNTDLFFARGNEKWDYGYAAEHQGCQGGWSGSSESVSLFGKNKLEDVFVGSSDAGILVLTDDANGDALFVDDVYSAFPDEIEAQARIAAIDEIRAGAGNDIIDLTSQLFEYAGDGVTIYGGLGNDVIWANSGENQLFGDAGNDRIVGGSDNDIIVGGAGNDRMHGGGGSDTFCFGENWGRDTIEQLADGSVTLWFENGSEEFWNAETLTYSDGVNKVTLKGVFADAVSLKFGEIETAIAGAFENAASEKIFEDKSKALIA